MKIKRLPWDSAFFQRNIARVDTDTPFRETDIKALEDSPYDSIYCFSEVPQPNLEAKGIALTDEKLTFSKPAESSTDFHPGFTPAETSPALRELFLSSGHQSRFRTDPVFTPYFERFYDQWLSNALNKTFADYFRCTGTPDDPSGLIVLKGNKASLHISIIAVSPAHQGQGLGRTLIKTASALAHQNHLPTLTVDTQRANTGAVAFYESLGFTLHHRAFIYHIHNPKY